MTTILDDVSGMSVAAESNSFLLKHLQQQTGGARDRQQTGASAGRSAAPAELASPQTSLQPLHLDSAALSLLQFEELQKNLRDLQKIVSPSQFIVFR